MPFAFQGQSQLDNNRRLRQSRRTHQLHSGITRPHVQPTEHPKHELTREQRQELARRRSETESLVYVAFLLVAFFAVLLLYHFVT